MRAILRKIREKVIFPFFYKIFSRTKASERMFFIVMLNEPCQGQAEHSIDILIGTN